MAMNPIGMQNKAASAIDSASKSLFASEAKNLEDNLVGKTVKLDTTGIQGIHPEIDDILREHARKNSPLLTPPESGGLPPAEPAPQAPSEVNPYTVPSQEPPVPPQAKMPPAQSPDYSGVNPSEMTPRRINGGPEYTDSQLADMGKEGSATDATNLANANKAGVNYDPSRSPLFPEKPSLGFRHDNPSTPVDMGPASYEQNSSPLRKEITASNLGFSGPAAPATPTRAYYGGIPSELEVPAQDALKIRRLIDGEVSYKKLGPYAQTAEAAERDAGLKAKADQIRGQIHGLGDDTSDILDQWSENIGYGKNLSKRAESTPTTVLTSPSIDRRALNKRVDEITGSDLTGLGEKLNDAKEMSNAMHSLNPLRMAGSAAGVGVKGSIKPLVNSSSLNTGLDNILRESLFKNSSQK
jgi:hypothetical protein